MPRLRRLVNIATAAMQQNTRWESDHTHGQHGPRERYTDRPSVMGEPVRQEDHLEKSCATLNLETEIDNQPINNEFVLLRTSPG